MSANNIKYRPLNWSISLNILKVSLVVVMLALSFTVEIFKYEAVADTGRVLSANNPVKIIDARIKYRSISDTIPIYSYTKCTEGKCPEYSPPKLQKAPIENLEVMQNVTANPIVKVSEKHKAKDKSAPKSKDSNYVYDYKKVDTSVALLNINNNLSYDFEVLSWPNGIISVPVKALADLLDISVTVNHMDNSVNFVQPGTENQVNIDYKKNRILVGQNLIQSQKPKLIYIKEGFIINDDIFIPEDIAKYIFDVKMSFNKESYSVNLNTSRMLKAMVHLDEQESYEYASETPADSAVVEKENKIFSIKQLKYNLDTSLEQVQGDQNNSNKSAGGGLGISGNLLGGQYNIGTNTYLNDQSFELGNYIATLDYTGIEKQLSLGTVFTRLSDLAIPGSNIIGLKFGSLGAVNSSVVLPRLITGNADNNSYVELFINDVFLERQAVRNGYYEFESIKYPVGSQVDVRVEQVNPDNTRKIVYNREFSQDKNWLAPKQREYLIFSGIDNSFTNNRFVLWGEDSNNLSQPFKLSSGLKFRQGLTDKLTSGINIAHSLTLNDPQPIIPVQNSSTAETYRINRSTSGYVMTTDLNYALRKNLRISSESGVSFASSKYRYEVDNADFSSFISADYNREDSHLFMKGFYYGPDFYPASYSITTDRRGLECSGNYSLNRINLYGSAVRYNSNLDRLFKGGLATITNLNMGVSGAIDKNASLRAGIRMIMGKNSSADRVQTDYNLGINSKLYDKANLNLEFIHSMSISKTQDSKMVNVNENFNTGIDIDADKLGIIRISNEVMMLDPEQSISVVGLSNYSYNPPVYKSVYLKLDRTARPIKNITLSPNIGYRYSGDNKGTLYGLGLGYLLGNGRQIMLNYAYNSVFARYLAGNAISNGSRSHSLSLNYVDKVDFGFAKYPGQKAGNQSAFNPENGIIKGTVFLDINQNAVKDPDEKGISDINLIVKDTYLITTDKKGNYVAPNLDERIYIVGIDKNTLPVFFIPTGRDVSVNVKKEKVYIANLGLIVTPGSIFGKITVNKGRGNQSELSDVILLLLDKNGKEVKYTTSDSNGGYYIGSIPPGDYTVVVDSNYLDYNGLKISGNVEQKITIPLIVDDFYEINDINFNLINK